MLVNVWASGQSLQCTDKIHTRCIFYIAYEYNLATFTCVIFRSKNPFEEEALHKAFYHPTRTKTWRDLKQEVINHHTCETTYISPIAKEGIPSNRHTYIDIVGTFFAALLSFDRFFLCVFSIRALFACNF